MRGARRPLLCGLALLAAALLLALLPGAAAGAASGALLALFLPGYALSLCLGTPVRLRVIDVLDCVAGSVAVTPVALRLAGLILKFDRPHLVAELTCVTLILLVLGTLRPRAGAATPGAPTPRAVILLVIATLLLLAPTLAVGPTADGGETRVKGWDLNNHLAIAESIASRGLPPLNPFLASDSPFYYHTFFHVLLAAVLVLAGQGVHSYLIIALLTSLLAAVFLATFYRTVAELGGSDRAALFALPLVSVIGGFDVVPMTCRALVEGEGPRSFADFFLRHWNVDGWVSNQGMLVPSFFATFYWSPHAVAAVIAFLLALLHLGKNDGRIVPSAAAGLCLASMAGYNGYVALGGAATLVILRGIELVRSFSSGNRTGRALFIRSAVTGAVAILLALPVLGLYVGQRGEVDKFRWVAPGWLLPLQVTMEFGPALPLGLAGLALVCRRNGAERLAPFLVMGAVSLPLICFVASTGENNDLAMRVSLLLWIALAVFGGAALDGLFQALPAGTQVAGTQAAGTQVARTAWVPALAALALGGLSVVWFAVGAAVAKPALPSDEVAAGRWVRAHIAAGRLVQASPLRDNPDLVYLSGHPAVLSDTWAGRLFYAETGDFARRMASLREAFSSPDPATACSILKSLGVAALVVGPPEEQEFPLLAHPDPRPCLSETFRQGSYRVYRVSP